MQIGLKGRGERREFYQNQVYGQEKKLFVVLGDEINHWPTLIKKRKTFLNAEEKQTKSKRNSSREPLSKQANQTR